MSSRSRRLLIAVAALVVLLQSGQFLTAHILIRRQNVAANRWDVIDTAASSISVDADEATLGSGIQSSSIVAIPPPFRNQDTDYGSFSACLLLCDDNHFLIEWLAYHYHALPLRYLVVAVDPRSRTSPGAILDRWRDYDLTIVRWTDRDFLPLEWQDRNFEDGDWKGLLMKHRERQRNFYPACFDHLRAGNRTWTVATDVDEYVHVNPNYAPKENVSGDGAVAGHSPATGAAPEASRMITVMDVVQGTPHYRNVSCITVPRLRFGLYEGDVSSNNSTFVPSRSSSSSSLLGLADHDFVTLRWKWHGPLGSRKANRLPKSMVDVSTIVGPFDRQDTDAHRPVRSACPRRNLYTSNADSPLVVHHYVGSREQFLFRRDAREATEQRGEGRLGEYGLIRAGMDESITGWLDRFSNRVGHHEAGRLLRGVGNVSFSPIIVHLADDFVTK
jgi:hypothetical protein